MSNYIALLFSVIGLALIVLIIWKYYKDNKKEQENPKSMIYHIGGIIGLSVFVGVIFLVVASIINKIS